MKKNSQKIIIVFLIVAVILASFSFLFSDKKKGVLAQDEGVLVCHEPISIGSSLDATLEAMDVLFRETQNIHQEISTQVNAASAALAAIGKNAVNCNTSIATCKAMCPSIPLNIMLRATLLWFITVARWHICIPACSSASCSGKPCPPLEIQVSSIKDSLASTTKSIQKINDVFSSSTEQIEEDIIKEEEIENIKNCLGTAPFDIETLYGLEIKIIKQAVKDCLLNFVEEEAVDTYVVCENKTEPEDCRWFLFAGLKKITKIEFAQRKLERTRADFHFWRMSPDDWEKVYREEITPRTAMKCLEALEERSYWPKWWTEDCEQYCKTDPYHIDCQDCLCTGCESTWGNDRCTDAFGTDNDPVECQECLDQSSIHQYSWLKATGCKFYGACQEECKETISIEEKQGCLTCLCAGLLPADECVQQHGGGDACDNECEKECKVVACQKWICGESMLNWTSCLSY